MGEIPTRYSPVCHSPCGAFDLHVLGLPPAFVLSQDQTLKLFRVWFAGRHCARKNQNSRCLSRRAMRASRRTLKHFEKRERYDDRHKRLSPEDRRPRPPSHESTCQTATLSCEDDLTPGITPSAVVTTARKGLAFRPARNPGLRDTRAAGPAERRYLLYAAC